MDEEIGLSTQFQAKAHVLKETTFKTPTFCSVCGKFLVGVFKQGLSCKSCKIAVHKKCVDTLEFPCKFAVDPDLSALANQLSNIDLKGSLKQQTMKGKDLLNFLIDKKAVTSPDAHAMIVNYIVSGGIKIEEEEIVKSICMPDDSSSISRSAVESLNLSEIKLTFTPGKWHLFEVTQFNKPSFCEECTGMLWGISKQGYRCKTCGFTCHFQCTNKVVTTCKVHSYVPPTTHHDFKTTTFMQPTYCNICRNLLYGVKNQGQKCNLCGMCKHPSCSGASTACKTFCVKKKSDSCKPGRCYLVEGNVRSKNCMVCNKTVGNSSSLTGFHCAWCHKGVHSGCVSDGAVFTCDYGAFEKILFPPNYILEKTIEGNDGDEPKKEYIYHAPPDVCPILVFINPKSGGQAGSRILEQMYRYLNPLQVFDLSQGGPGPGLRAFKHLKRFGILACGGDGTGCWVLSELDKLNFPADCRPAVGMLPLGTGNDLARILGMGPGYNGEPVKEILMKILDSKMTLLDRWAVKITDLNGETKTSFTMNNYFSMGLDARIALGFHEAREKNPERFKNRYKNYMHYATIATKEMMNGVNLNKKLKIFCDGVEIKLPNVESIVFLNIPSYGGGIDLWNKKPSDSKTNENTENEKLENSSSSGQEFVAQSINDGFLEIVGFKDFLHMGVVQGHVASGLKIAQARSIRVECLDPELSIPTQIDGEPWLQEPCVIEMNHYNRVPMLCLKK